MPDLWQAIDRGFASVLLGTLPDVDLNRWLSGSYVIPVSKSDGEDEE